MRLLLTMMILMPVPAIAAPSFIVEFSPLRAAISESDVRAELALTESLSAGFRMSQYARASKILPEETDFEDRYEATLLYYPRLADIAGFFIGPKLSYIRFEESFMAPVPVRTYAEFRTDPDMTWRSEIKRLSAGGHIGWRAGLGQYATFAVSADILSTISEQVELLDQDQDNKRVNPKDQAPDHFEKLIMLHFGLAIP